MPELPEVETVRRGLVDVLTGREIVQAEIMDGRLTAPVPPDVLPTSCSAQSSRASGGAASTW